MSKAHDDTTIRDGSPAIAKNSGNESDDDEDNSKPPAQQQPQEAPAQDNTSASREHNPSQMEVKLDSLTPSDKEMFIAADARRRENERNVISTHAHLLEVKSEIRKVQTKLEKAQDTYEQAVAISKKHSGQDADALLLAPSEWNSRYLQLKAYFEREGHSHLKKIISDADVKGMSEAEAAEVRALSRWTFRQRKLKRNGDLEDHKEFLLDRLRFDWDAKAAHSLGIWLKNYNLLKEFKARHGHLDVPIQQGQDELASWMKTQTTLYQNGKAGKLPALDDERICMLEKLDICWGVRRKVIPWDDQYKELLEYKKRFGNVHVPWQWKENKVLAQWVNTQRKKYKDLIGGKKSSLTEEQINKLNSVNFKWSNGRKGRYPDGSQDQPSAKKARTSEEAESFIKFKYAAAVAGMHAPSASSSTNSSISLVPGEHDSSSSGAKQDSSSSSGAKQYSTLSSSGANALQNPAAQAIASAQNAPMNFLLPQASHVPSQQAMQLLTQQLLQQPQGVVQPLSIMLPHQPFLHHYQRPIQPSSNTAVGTPQAPQLSNDQVIQYLQQLLGLINQGSQNPSNNQLLINACQQLLAQQPIQRLSNNAAGTLQAPQNNQSNQAIVYQQILDLINQGSGNAQPDQNMKDAGR